MGYYCYFRLEIIHPTKNKRLKNDAKHQIIQEIYDDKDMDPHEFSKDAINLDGESHNESKWFNAENHIAKISKNHPELVFILGQEACAPDSEEEEGEIFFAIQNGEVRGINEPEFMKAPSLFKTREELEDAATVMSKGNTIDIIFHGHENLRDFIYKKLKTTPFNEQIHTTLTFGFGSPSETVTAEIKTEKLEEFWQEAAKVLVE